ncbi:hypothetical protein [Actinomycetospora sp.]|jgi:hypothetical protein|uniref:hypothetical protein n=1 Tax=Actinomycetospora sp. TaxID=1872135 RepID=UPI002F3F5A96
MGAHTAPGHHPGRTATATAGVAVALVTTATGVLTGGTALASEGHAGSGHSGHSHDGQDSRSDHGDFQDAATERVDGAHGFAQQTLCDVLGDVDLGGSCSSDDGGRTSQSSSSDDGSDSSGSDFSDSDSSRSDSSASDSDHDSSSGLFGSSFPGQTGSSSTHQATPAPAPKQAPKPAPKPTSIVPNKTTVQPIAGQAPAAGSAPSSQPIGG